VAEADLLTRIAERAEVSEEDTERVLEVVVEDLAATVRERMGKPLTVEVPLYFDRYVTSEINRLSGQIADLEKDVAQGFAELRGEMDRRFGEVDRRFGELRGEMNQRFEEVDRRFGEVDRRFGEVRGEMNRRFEQVDRRFDRIDHWFLGVGVPLVLGILAIIVKVFFGP